MKKNENKNHIETDESNLNKETHVCMLFLTEIQGVEEGVKPQIYRFCSQVLYQLDRKHQSTLLNALLKHIYLKRLLVRLFIYLFIY